MNSNMALNCLTYQCVEEGWKYHQYECGQLDLLHSIGESGFDEVAYL